MIKAILAHGVNGEIGQEGDMPWRRSLPKDLEYFKEVTVEEIVVMGHNTLKSLPFENGLPKRKNYVICSELSGLQNDKWVAIKGMDKFKKMCMDRMNIFNNESFWVIGGGSVYKQMENLIDEYHITTVKQSYPEADTFFKPDLSVFEKVGEEIDVGNGELEASVQVWRRKK